MLALRWMIRILGLVSMVILARLLTPGDFGLVAMAMVVYALIDSMATTGVDLALIRDQRDSLELYDGAWTIQVLQGIFIAILMLASIPFAVAYFEESRLQTILSLLALSALIQGFRNIGTVAFRKELDFAKDFRFAVYQKLGVFAVTVTLALWLRDIPFSVSAAVGFIALGGIAVLNGQILVSAIRSFLAQGNELRSAITEATQQRLRPVLATAITDAVGFLPMSISTGVGAEVQRPLATVVVAGVLTSTALTLFVLPILYLLVMKKVPATTDGEVA